MEILLLTNKFSQAIIFCKNYCPSKTSEVFTQWKQNLEQKGNLLSKKIANPLDLPENFPDYQFLIEVEEVVSKELYEKDVPSDQLAEYEEKFNEVDFYTYAKENGIEELTNFLKEQLSAPEEETN